MRGSRRSSERTTSPHARFSIRVHAWRWAFRTRIGNCMLESMLHWQNQCTQLLHGPINGGPELELPTWAPLQEMELKSILSTCTLVTGG